MPNEAAARKQPAAPEVLTEFPGTFSVENSPPNATIAASPTRVIQLTNFNYLIVDRAQQTLGEGTLHQLAHAKESTFVSDEQIIWDPASKRFYFSAFENRGSSEPDEGIVWGFSKTASPSSADDFCSYFTEFDYRKSSFPDRESLGDTRDFLLIGSNRFLTSNEGEVGSDVAWITKPPAGTGCPGQSAFKAGIHNLGRTFETAPLDPVAGRQADASTSGSILSTVCCGGSNLDLIKVTESAAGEAQFGAIEPVPVPTYALPPLVPQAGLTKTGERPRPLQNRVYFTQAISAYDPRLHHEVLWAAHAIAGGAGSEVRWYEIDPARARVGRSGTVSDPNLDVFNATISPDRLIRNHGGKFGSSAVMTVNTASETAFAAIQILGIANGQRSRLVLVEQSPGPDVDFSCFGSRPECRWGDNSGAAPDPGGSASGKTGAVWLTNQWNGGDINDQTPAWRTIVLRASP